MTWIAFFFLVHGIAYFFVPSDVHNEASPFKYIKYILILAFITLSITENIRAKLWYFALWIPLYFYYSAINKLGDPVFFVSYLLPFYFFLSPRHLMMVNWKNVILYTIIICSIAGYTEIFFLKNHFYMYNRSLDAYRLVSIYLNPNNLGITMALLTFAYIILYSGNQTMSLILFVNGAVIIFLSVSKTGYAVFGMLTLFVVYTYLTARKLSMRVRPRYVVLSVAVLPVVAYALYRFVSDFDFSNTREISWATLAVRFEGNALFFDLVRQNFFFPWIHRPENLDNMYIHLWGSFGLPFLLLFLFFNSVLLVWLRNSFAVVFLLIFLILGFTTDALYLWPIGYFYWGVAGVAVFQRSHRSAHSQLRIILKSCGIEH
ncbi:MAG: hypothetical protein WDO15_28970 [Bacteroidota bacterium]